MNFTFFSSAHRTFSRIDHILGHKSSLGKFKKIEIIPTIFSDHNALRLDLNYRRKTMKNSNIWRLNNTLLNNQQITEESKKEIKICIETNENENTAPNLWDSEMATHSSILAWKIPWMEGPGGKGLRGGGAGKPQGSSRGRPGCRGTLWGPSRVPSTVSTSNS